MRILNATILLAVLLTGAAAAAEGQGGKADGRTDAGASTTSMGATRVSRRRKQEEREREDHEEQHSTSDESSPCMKTARSAHRPEACKCFGAYKIRKRSNLKFLIPPIMILTPPQPA